MNEIRFTPPAPAPAAKALLPEKPQKRGGSVKKIIVVFLVLAIILALAFAAADYFSLLGERKMGDNYSAVFLINGQVYFGKMVKASGAEIVLNDVYYLQATPEGGGASQETFDALNQSRFNLVKLGNELHGPTDELFINRDQVIFYEYLRDDSKVVESIKAQK